MILPIFLLYWNRIFFTDDLYFLAKVLYMLYDMM